MYRTIAFILIIISAFVVPCGAAEPASLQVLETPAVKSYLAEKSLLNDVALAGNRLVCVGWRGHIIYSDDQGKSWTQSNVPVSCDLVAVHFPTPKKGWAVGHEGVVLHTLDGGSTWIKQFDGRLAAQVMMTYYTKNPPKNLSSGSQAVSRLMEDVKRFVQEGPDKPFLDVWFENETTGFIVGAFNLIFRTTDGGKNWEPWYDRTENPRCLHFYAIRSVGKDIFIAGEQGLIQKLDRREGRFREMKTSYQGTFFGITGKPGAVIVFGLRGNVFRSCDERQNWQKIKTGIPVGLTDATVTEDGRIILVSQAGNILVSKDDGASFNPVSVEPLFPMAAVCAIKNNALVLTGLGGVQVQSLK